MPKWVILRNHSGLQVQLFWEAKDPTENPPSPPKVPSTNGPAKKRSKRKRSPQRIIPSDDETHSAKYER